MNIEPMKLDPPDALDHAIDDVARQLVSAPRDSEMVSRIVAALPPRRSPWITSAPRWLIHAAGVASVAAVAVLWLGRGPAEQGSPLSAQPIAATPITALSRWSAATAVNAVDAARAGGRVRPAPAPPIDHERALAPVAGPHEIAVAALAPAALDVAARPDIAPKTLEPLTIDALVDGGAPPDSKEL